MQKPATCSVVYDDEVEGMRHVRRRLKLLYYWKLQHTDL
jgi:hypothetical protein